MVLARAIMMAVLAALLALSSLSDLNAQVAPIPDDDLGYTLTLDLETSEIGKKLSQAEAYFRSPSPEKARDFGRDMLDKTTTKVEHLAVLMWLTRNATKWRSNIWAEHAFWSKHPRTPSSIMKIGFAIAHYEDERATYDHVRDYIEAEGGKVKDTRRFVSPRLFPSIGRLVTDDGHLTAFLIDDCHIATSRHAWAFPELGNSATFHIGVGAHDGFADVVPATLIAAGSMAIGVPWTAADWAVLKLSRCVGREYGHLVVHPFPEDYTGEDMLIVGYPGDRDYHAGLSLLSNCEARQIVEIWVSTCFAVPGSSGSPLLHRTQSGEMIVVGLLSNVPKDRSISAVYSTPVYWMGRQLADMHPELAGRIGFQDGRWISREPELPFVEPPPPAPVPR